jgi:hypothetical protein
MKHFRLQACVGVLLATVGSAARAQAPSIPPSPGWTQGLPGATGPAGPAGGAGAITCKFCPNTGVCQCDSSTAIANGGGVGCPFGSFAVLSARNAVLNPRQWLGLCRTSDGSSDVVPSVTDVTCMEP